MDVIITYETLFDILRKEKGREELQELPRSFYRQVVTYLAERKRDVDAAGGFGSPKAQRALVQYRNVEKILRELYERRERKIIEMALNRARTERNIVNTGALLAEEERFFEDAAALLTRARGEVLQPALRGEVPVNSPPPEESPQEPSPAPTEAQEETQQSPEELATLESCKVAFKAEVPRFLGLEGEVLGPFKPGDTAELPGKIAALLVKKNRAEPA